MQMMQTINVRGRLMSLDKPVVMGILNATPDSFFEGSRVMAEHEIARRANQIVEEGGTIIDVGAFSTRPGAQEVTEAEESERLERALRIVRREQPQVAVSVDTFRPRVARRCIEEWGADIINDVSEGGQTGIVNTPIHEEERMFDVVADLHVPYILMSVQPAMEKMLLAFCRELQELHSLGVSDVIVDPGFGFGKTLDENYRVMAALSELQALRQPILVGVSRKSMIYRLFDSTPQGALNGTTALHVMALQAGARLLRVHDVRQAVETVTLFEKVANS
ncbi:MAG: dihydropteroate synthase [Prevotella sp.]|nr:dihydropteroate synthase [Prevotella sp.]